MRDPAFDCDDEDDGYGFGFNLGPLLDLSPEGEAMAQAIVDGMRTTLAPGDPRRHHYVPKFFLRRFAEGDNIARVRVESPTRHDIASVNDVAVMKDLYTVIDDDVGETVGVERMLGMVDGEAKPAMERLALGLLFPPQERDRLALALWLSMLHVRGPSTRRLFEVLADQTMKMELSLIHDEAGARAYLRRDDGVEPSDEDVRALLDAVEEMDEWEITPHQNSMVKDMLRMGLEASPFFLGRRWAIVKFPVDGLVLTDKPLTLYQRPENASPWMGIGLATADELWLPLDRRTALVLHNDESLGEVVIKAPTDRSIDDFNQTVLSQADREVYCHPDDVFRLGRLKFPDPNRPLMQASGAAWIRGSTDGVNEVPKRRGHHRYRRPGPS